MPLRLSAVEVVIALGRPHASFVPIRPVARLDPAQVFRVGREHTIGIALRLEQLSKTFGERDAAVHAVDAVSLTVDDAEILLIQGRPAPERPPCSPWPAD